IITTQLHQYIHSFPTRRSSDLTINLPVTHHHSRQTLDLINLGGHGKVDLMVKQLPDPGRVQKAQQRKFSRTAVKPLSHMLTALLDRKSTRLNSSHVATSYAVFC